MKRIICLFLALMCAGSLVACNFELAGVTTSTETADTTEASSESKTDVTTDADTDIDTDTDADTDGEETTAEEFNGITVDRSNTATYSDSVISFEYPAEWDMESYETFGYVSFGESVEINISTSESTGMFATLTQEMYDSVFVPMYSEMGIEITTSVVSHKTNDGGVKITVIEQSAKYAIGTVPVPFEWTMYIVTVGDYEVTLQIMEMAPVVGLAELVFDTLKVVYDGEELFPDDPIGYENITDQLFVDDGVRSFDGKQVFKTEAQKLAPGESVATKFTVTEGQLLSVYLDECPSWNDNNGTVVLYIYEWIDGEGSTEQAILKDGYQKTIATAPITYKKFRSYRDNAKLSLDLEKYNVAEGTYLVVLVNPSAEEDLGVGYYKSSYDARAFYGSVVYGLPESLQGYYPMFTTDVVAFRSNGMPGTAGYMNLHVEANVPIY